MKSAVFNLIIALIMLTNTGCYAARIDGPYEGKIIDADTGYPIEGVVVLGTWHSITVTPGGGTSKFYDAQETVTDKNGEFRIQGLGLKILSNVEPPYITTFKAGYSYDNFFWIPDVTPFGNTIRWEDKKVIIHLRKLTMEERQERDTPDFYIGQRYDKKENITHSCLPINIKLLPNEVNKELLEKGRNPYDLERGLCEK